MVPGACALRITGLARAIRGTVREELSDALDVIIIILGSGSEMLLSIKNSISIY